MFTLRSVVKWGSFALCDTLQAAMIVEQVTRFLNPEVANFLFPFL